MVLLLLVLLTALSMTPTVTLAFDPPDIFPASTRQALANKARMVNANPPPGRYTASGWSNRAATALTPQHLNPGVYTADRPFYWNNIDVGCRCTVLELPSSSTDQKPDLWVHSPVGLDGPLRDALDVLGTVKYVVPPNYEHVKFAAEWATAYPNAQMWGCPGLSERLPNVPWMGELPQGCRPSGWTGAIPEGTHVLKDGDLPWDTNVIQPLHIDFEVNPFTGRPFFNEVVYYHTPSKALLVTDFYWNYPASGIPNSQYGRNDAWELAPPVSDVPFGTRLWKTGMDKVYGPFFRNFMVQRPDAYRDTVQHILNQWDVELIIPAHGDLLRGKDFIRTVLTEHFQV